MTLQEMAAEYRRTGAQLAAAIKAKEKAVADGDTSAREEVSLLKQMLTENRSIRRNMAHYYDLPRDPEVSFITYGITRAEKGRRHG